MNTIKDLNGKVAVVTGGANGIGREMARRFLHEGMKVVIADIDDAAMDDAVQDLGGGDRLLALHCDISTMAANQELASKTVAHFGGVNIVCLNAALLGEVQGWRASDVTEEAWRKTLATNLDSHFYGMKAFLPYLEKEQDARLIFSASSFSLMTGLGDPAPYFVGQAGLLAFAECLHWDLEGRDSHIGLSCLLVGNTFTGPYYFLKDELKATEGNEDAWDSSTWGSRSYIAELIDHITKVGTPCAVVVESMIDAIHNDKFYVAPNVGPHWDHIDHRMDNIKAGSNPSYYEKTLCVYRSVDADQ